MLMQEQANYKQLHAEMESELQRLRKEASDHAAALSADGKAAQEAASAARSEAARSRVSPAAFTWEPSCSYYFPLQLSLHLVEAFDCL